MNQLQPWLQSSADPTQVSNKVRGLILLLSSGIGAMVLSYLKITITPSDLGSLATDFGMIAGGIWGIYGLLLHGAIKVGSVKQ